MSQDASDEEIPLPRRHRPTRERTPADDVEEILAEETWKPNPRKAGRPQPPAGAAGGAAARQARKNPERAGIEKEPAAARGGPGWFERLIFGSISSAQIAMFSRQFAAYLDAGVDLLKSLSSLRKQFNRTALGPVIDRLEQSVRRGQTLGEAMKREPQAFGPMYLGLMHVAEARGGVPETLRLLSEYYDARTRMIRQARSAMIYPIAVLSVGFLVVMFLSYKILPMFAELLADIAGRGASLPLPSQMLIGFSNFVKSFGWWLIPAATVGGLFLAFRYYRTSAGKALIDRLALYVPVLGPLLRKIDTARFARTMSALQEGGLDIGASIDLSADVVATAPFRSAIRSTRRTVMEGGLLSEALEETGRFTPDVISIVESGEETGKLPETLAKLADDYDEQVEYTVKNLGQLIQPLLMIFMGAIVLFIILAVFLPYLSILTSLAG